MRMRRYDALAPCIVWQPPGLVAEGKRGMEPACGSFLALCGVPGAPFGLQPPAGEVGGGQRLRQKLRCYHRWRWGGGSDYITWGWQRPLGDPQEWPHLLCMVFIYLICFCSSRRAAYNKTANAQFLSKCNWPYWEDGQQFRHGGSFSSVCFSL